ncbi:hypothetical protein ACI76Y_11530 [Capnocytophaga cynodegmi]|uniref:hypothetical protein n=1 Tax=Capnocytophaga cynodegmi TaxID=28189 RepID=UPI00385BEFAB
MKFTIKGFVTNKQSELYSDCADSYAFDTKKHRFAISDGVSISFFSEIWSQILVDNYVKDSCEVNSEFISECQREWQEKIEEIVHLPNVKWFVKTKYSKKDFAAATFIGLEFLQDEKKWIAQFIGDSFLFFVPKNCSDFQYVLKYPSKRDFVFDNYPDYLASTENNQRGELHTSVEEKIKEGTFFLMTDALSEWFISEMKKDVKNAVDLLVNIENQEDFLKIIREQRDENLLKNDDSTVLIIEVTNDEQEEFSYSVTHFTNLKNRDFKEQKIDEQIPNKQKENQELSVFDKF